MPPPVQRLMRFFDIAPAVLASCTLQFGLGCTPTHRDDVEDHKPPQNPKRAQRDEPEPKPQPKPVDPPCFAPPIVSPLEFAPGGSRAGDFNGDGTPDYVTFRDELREGVFVPHMETYLGDRRGHFRKAGSVEYIPGEIGLAPAMGLIDDDAHLDLVTGDHRAGTFTEWRGDGVGAFSRMHVQRVGRSPHGPHLADLNHDGRDDIVVPRYRVIEMHESRRQGRYRPFPSLKVAKSKAIATPEGLSFADLDLDGNVDLVAPLSDDNAIEVYLGKGNGRFRRLRRIDDPCSSPQDSAVGPLVHLGVPSIAVGCADDTVLIFDSIDGLDTPRKLAAPGYLVDLVAADLTGDARSELIGSGFGFESTDAARAAIDEGRGGYLVVWRATAEGELAEWSRVPVGMHYTHGLHVHDFDEDGLADIAFAGGGGTPGSHFGVSFGQACPAR